MYKLASKRFYTKWLGFYWYGILFKFSFKSKSPMNNEKKMEIQTY